MGVKVGFRKSGGSKRVGFGGCVVVVVDERKWKEGLQADIYTHFEFL